MEASVAGAELGVERGGGEGREGQTLLERPWPYKKVKFSHWEHSAHMFWALPCPRHPSVSFLPSSLLLPPLLPPPSLPSSFLVLFAAEDASSCVCVSVSLAVSALSLSRLQQC